MSIKLYFNGFLNPPVALHQGEQRTRISQEKKSGEAAVLSKSAANKDGAKESPGEENKSTDLGLQNLVYFTTCSILYSIHTYIWI